MFIAYLTTRESAGVYLEGGRRNGTYVTSLRNSILQKTSKIFAPVFDSGVCWGLQNAVKIAISSKEHREALNVLRGESVVHHSVRDFTWPTRY
jgi:hypothetical protein